MYFGDYRTADAYSIVDSGQDEVDYVSTTGEDKTSQYEGDGGVPLSNVVKKAAFAARVGNINPLISSLVGDNARAMYETNIQDRARKAAPFLQMDNDPYPVVSEGRILWVQDAYTATTHYPYAQKTNTQQLAAGSDLKGDSFNYLRNSVKIVTDAYSGEMKFYVTDAADPIIKAWQKAFPEIVHVSRQNFC